MDIQKLYIQINSHYFLDFYQNYTTKSKVYFKRFADWGLTSESSHISRLLPTYCPNPIVLICNSNKLHSRIFYLLTQLRPEVY